MHNDGKKYERFVASLQQAMINSETITVQKNINIELNKKIIDNCGVEREFDLYWEYELGGITYKTIIECKDYNSDISVEKIDSLIGKIKDIPDIKPIFATKRGYQIGAKTKADHNKIDLLIVREQNETDWRDKDGNPYIKIIDINIHYSPQARILKFVPRVDGNWLKENTNIDPSKPLNIEERNDRIFIDDLDGSTKYSLLELQNQLTLAHEGEYGKFEKEKIFANAFILYGDLKLKLESYKLEYIINRPIEQPLQIDFSKELIGVIEYLQKGTKKSIFRNGMIK